MSTRSPASASAAAVTATLLNRQNPIAWVGSAWWPGGRTAQNAASASPRRRASTAVSPAPAARRAADHDAGTAVVSASSRPPPVWQKRSSAPMYVGVCTRSRSVDDAASAATRIRPSSSPDRRTPSSTADSRAGRSGCPMPVS